MFRRIYFLPVLLVSLLVLAMSTLAAGASPSPVSRSEPIIIDHRHTDISQIPEYWINQAKEMLRLSYGHTSHGSQLVSGMGTIMSGNSLYSFNTTGSIAAGILSLDDYTPDGDLGSPDRVTWASRTDTYLTGPSGTGPSRNVVMWSWCGQVSSSSQTDINTYLGLMNALEIEYPSVNFVYMTGHLDGVTDGNLKIRNAQIRDYVLANNKVLFDFADIDSYDPDGNYYASESDACAWCTSWCSSHPEDCQNLPSSCAHSHSLQCKLKGQAFWWLMARLAGWQGPTATVTISGDAGIDGATLKYTDVTPKTVIADGSGDYTLTVPYNWSGTVTPYKVGYAFSPANILYANVVANQTDEDYTARVIPTVSTIVRVGSASTSATSVNFTATFSESVTGVDTADFKLTNTLLTGASVTGVGGSGTVYTVAVNTGTGNGTIRLDVPATATIQGLDGDYFADSYVDGQIYTVDKGTAPTVPVLVSPANGTLVSGYKPTLDWNDSTPIMALANDWSYEINVTDNLGTYDQTFNTASGLSNSSYTFTTALPVSTIFSWKVRAYNDGNQFSAWSASRTFSTGSKLDTPVLSLPVDGTTENNKRPTFNWVAMPGAASYTLQILADSKVVVTGTIKAPAHTFIPTVDLLPSTLYTWKVKANNGVNSGDYSTPFTFTTSPNPPKMPVLTLPANATLLDSAAVQILKWLPVPAVTTTSPATTYPAAASFQVEYATNSTFSDAIAMVVNSNVDTQISLPIGTLLPNRTYYWRVRSWSAAGAAGNHSAWSLVRTLRTRLATPVLNLPANSALLDNKRPTFGWDEVNGATSYTLQILNGTKVVNTGTIKVPAYVYTPTADLLPSTTYQWKVKANGTNAGIYSTPFTFTTSGNPPKMPVLSAPSNGILVDSTAPQTLKWSPVLAVTTSSTSTTYPAALSYQVEYAMNSSFTGTSDTFVILSAPTTQTSPIPLLPGRTYYWRVRSWSGAGATGNHSAWSLVRTIKVKFVAPTLTSPAAGATSVGVRPTFTWNSTNGLWTSYTLQVATTTAFGTGTRSFTVAAPFTTFTISDSLPALTPGTTYYWRVKINGLYTPITSATWSFVP